MKFYPRIIILAVLCYGFLFTPGCACINTLLSYFPLALLCVQNTPDGENTIIETGQQVMFSEGLAAVCYNDRWGYIDTKGAWVIPPRYESASAFRSGTAEVSVGGRTCLIDRAGSVTGEVSPFAERYVSAYPAK